MNAVCTTDQICFMLKILLPNKKCLHCSRRFLYKWCRWWKSIPVLWPSETLNPPGRVTTCTYPWLSSDKRLHLPSRWASPHPGNKGLKSRQRSPKKSREIRHWCLLEWPSPDSRSTEQRLTRMEKLIIKRDTFPFSSHVPRYRRWR